MNSPAPTDLNPFSAPVVAAPTGASAQALAQREVSDVQAAMMIARRFPRDMKLAVDRILMSCTRVSLAEDAVYEYARGGSKVTGPSIRLAEEIARQWGNMVCGVAELSRYAGQSEVLAYAQDLETGFRDEKRFTVRHWRDTKQGGKAVTEERDIYEVIANMGARRKRACILALIPGDVVDAAVKQCELTIEQGQGEITPDAIKKILGHFAGYGVNREMIEKRIQRNAEAMTQGIRAHLSRIYTSLKEGMSKPEDWFDMALGAPAPAAAAGTTVHTTDTGPVGAQAKTAADSAKEKLRAHGTPPPKETQEPFYTAESAAKLLRGSTSAAALTRNWNLIVQDFQASERELPVEVEAAYNERGEALADEARETDL